MRKLVLALFVCIALGLTGAAQYRYAFYHDNTPGRDVEVNLLNTMDWAADITIEVYDAYGDLVWSDYGTIPAYSGGYWALSDYLPSYNTNYGVVTVESTEQLVIGLEYYSGAQLVSVDTVYTELPVLSSNELFWLGTYYTQVQPSSTGMILMNPWNFPAACTVTAYDTMGSVVFTQDIVLSAHEAVFHDLTEFLGHGAYMWGLLDVQMQDRAVILAMEYYNRGCAQLEVDNVTDYYY